MNIIEAKNEILNTIKIYLSKNEYGDYIIDVARQRPIFLLGAPGIGKTAIVNDIAKNLNLGFVSYTITHHTRQSAIGLPYIENKTYNGEQFSVTQYTLSEIITEIYDQIEKSGKKEGVLFIDEINCVSETLAPAMLELLQNKRFGSHRIPNGWLLISAGNPVEYNKSVNEFDVATLDRLKCIEIKADYNSFKLYAQQIGVNASILSYLDVKKQNLFVIEKTIDGYKFVTPRGWEDLSVMITGYELANLEVNLPLIKEYIQNEEIAMEFYRYYLLFIKYKNTYNLVEIFKGNWNEEIKKLENAKFDEKYALVDVMASSVSDKALMVATKSQAVKHIHVFIESNKNSKDLDKCVDTEKAKLIKLVEDSATLNSQKPVYRLIIDILSKGDLITEYENASNKLNELIEQSKIEITNCFKFLNEAFSNGQEMVAFMTNLISNQNFVLFVAEYNLQIFYEYNQLLLVDNENEILKKQIANLI